MGGNLYSNTNLHIYRAPELVYETHQIVAAIIADKKRTVLCDGKSRWTPPDLFIRYEQTDHEIVVFPRWLAVLVERKTHINTRLLVSSVGITRSRRYPAGSVR